MSRLYSHLYRSLVLSKRKKMADCPPFFPYSWDNVTNTYQPIKLEDIIL